MNDAVDCEDEDMLLEVDWTYETPQEPLHDGPQRDRRNTSEDVISQIEAVFETVADALLNERSDISISLTAHSHSISLEDDVAPPKARRTRGSVFTFPGKSNDEAWRFSVVLRLLELIHECISGGVILTKRYSCDMHYRDPALFGKQSTVDRYIDHIASAFEVPRSLLNVTAAAKGLMAGAAVIHKRDGSKIDFGGIQRSGILVPRMDEVLSVDITRARWILVVEKEVNSVGSAYIALSLIPLTGNIPICPIIYKLEGDSVARDRHYCGFGFCAHMKDPSWADIIQGKGYPDIATRAMTRFLSVATPRNGFAEPPVYGLMDYDPDGLAILQTYRHGSSKPSKEKDSLVVPNMQWLGLRSRDITDEDHTHRNQGLMPLTPRDRRKAINMLDNERVVGQQEADEQRRELQVMLMLNLKAEIQIIDSDPSGLDTLIMKGVSNA